MDFSQMDGPYSSGEEFILKARKPYTITKQRERWTEEEHNRFLEALKLYGRAWQRIEEHIGTKTAVQIRSHAQKFFTKLEKEALVKGIPVGQAIDIEIPPPRPKRKPSIPYPRKLGNRHPVSQVGSRNGQSGTSVFPVPLAEDTIDLEREPPPERPGDENSEEQVENTKSKSCVLQVHTVNLSSSVNKNSFSALGARRPCAFKKYVPNLEEVVNSDEVNKSYVTVKARDELYIDGVDIENTFLEKNVCDDTSVKNPPTANENCSRGILTEEDEPKLKNDMQATPSRPRHVPVHVLDGNLGIDTLRINPQMAYHESIMHPSDGAHCKPFMDHCTSVTSEHCTSTSNITIDQPLPSFHPIFAPIQNHGDYQSFIHASSTFSNLLVSTLLQNPTAHAAASFAASFWSCGSTEVPACNPGGFPVGSINAAPSVAAIAAATVASATAWWAAHGLLPLCAPYQMGLSYATASASLVPMGVSLARAHDHERGKEANTPATETQQIKPEYSEALQGKHLGLKSPALSSSDSDENNVLKSSERLVMEAAEQSGIEPVLHDSNKPKGRKPVERSSCGSNTPSSSEVDTDGLEKQGKNKEGSGVPTVNHPAGDANGRRARSSSCSSDSWKEVSEEGRLAFQALFSREVLPQSFSPPYDSKNKGKSLADKDQQNSYGIDDEGSKFDLNGKIWFNFSSNQEVEKNAHRSSESSIKKDGLLITGKFKVRRTGFKPYKRCSAEVKESRGSCATGSHDQEKGPKRVRLEGETSA